jgi:hypothetical protein
MLFYFKSSPTLGYFLHGKIYALVMTKYGLGYVLGDFFANSSGHPVQNSHETLVIQIFDWWA